MERFSLSTLFYMFYCMPAEKHSAVAAVVLYKRGWVYYPKDQVWYCPNEGKVFDTQTFTIVESSVPTGNSLTQDEVKMKKV